MGDDLTPQDFERATHDAGFRDFLKQQYGLTDTDLPPLAATGSPLTVDPIAGTGYGRLAQMGHLMQVGLHGAAKGLGDLASTGVGGFLAPTMGRGNQAVMGAMTDKMLELPGLRSLAASPTTPGERIVHAGARGAVATGGIGGAPGVASGLAGGTSAQAAAEAGAGPVGQILAGIAGGAAGGFGVSQLQRLGNPQVGAAKIVRSYAKADELPDIPEALGPRVERGIAVRVAGQSGRPADQLGQRARQTLDQHRADIRSVVNPARENIERLKDQSLAAERGLRDAITSTRQQSHVEISRIAEAERLTRQARQEQASRLVSEALATSTGDQMAGAVERAAGLPSQTLRQMTQQAEQALAETGKRVFGALDDVELPPGPEGQAVFEALGDPEVGGLIRSAYNTFAPQVEHLPRFQELQKAYQLLGAKARAAAINGGALDGTLMTDWYRARDVLGQSMDAAIPGFRDANAAYRAQAAVVDALHEGPLLATKGKAPDIMDRMQALEQIGGPEAAEALRLSLGKAVVGRMREMPITRDAAGRLAASGSDEVARLRTLFPSEEAFQSFVDDLSGATRRMGMAHQQGQDLVRSVGPEFAARRQQVREQTLGEVRRMGKDVRLQQDRTQQSIRRVRQATRDQVESLRYGDPIRREQLETARDVMRAAKKIDPPSGGRPLKGAVELGAGARARGIIDVVYGLFGKKSDPVDVRQVLTDYLLASPEQQRMMAGAMRQTLNQRGASTRLGAGIGAVSSLSAGGQ